MKPKSPVERSREIVRAWGPFAEWLRAALTHPSGPDGECQSPICKRARWNL